MARSFFQSAKGKSTIGLTIYLDAGVAHQDVDLAVLGHGVGDALLDLGLVRDVHGDGKSIGPLGLNLLGRGARGIEVEIGDDGDGACGGQTERDLLADAACRTGDDGNSSFEVGH
jgi:hypothetical protein